jgi:hypothetical protein
MLAPLRSAWEKKDREYHLALSRYKTPFNMKIQLWKLRLSLASFLASSIKLSGSRQLSVFLTVCDISMKLKIKYTFT